MVFAFLYIILNSDFVNELLKDYANLLSKHLFFPFFTYYEIFYSTVFHEYSQKKLDELTAMILFGLPGEKKITIPEVLDRLNWYKDVDHAALRENLKYFLQEITPVANELNIKLAIHPDDPPFDVLGLPRIVSNKKDIDFIKSAGCDHESDPEMS